MDLVIITAEAIISNTRYKATAVTTTCPMDLQLLSSSMETATLVATTEAVAATVGALVLYAVLTGTKPSRVLRHVKASVPLPKEIFVLKSMSC